MSYHVENPELGRAVLDAIDANPERLYMGSWGYSHGGCGTTACLAGHTMIAAGYHLSGYCFYRPDGEMVTHEAKEAEQLLGMTGSDVPGVELWFDFENGPDRFRKMIEEAEGAQ